MSKPNTARVVKDPPVRCTLGKQRIRKAIQEVMREGLSAVKPPSSNGKRAGGPVKPARAPLRKKNRAQLAS